MRVKIKQGPKTEKALRGAMNVFWERLKECAPFVRGTLNSIGIKKGGKRAAHSLVYRDGESIKTTYIPAKELKEVRQMADNYKEAKRLLNQLADCELKLLKHRIEHRKRTEQTA